MAIGLGILLIVAGLVLVLDVVNVDINYVNDNALGWVLLIAGILAIVLSLIISSQWSRRDRTVVEDRRL